jgi:Uma2 family endonuclease
MTIASTQTRFTPEDLLNLDGDGLYELVDGKLVEKRMSFLATTTASLISHYLVDYALRMRAGKVATEQGFQCFPADADLVRRPDIAFIAADRAKTIPDEGHVRIPPDLAIEVISPGDRIYEFEEKLADYRSAGIKLVWEVNPKFRYVRVHHSDRSSVRLEEGDTITGEGVLPGFSIRVKDLLPPVSPES